MVSNHRKMHCLIDDRETALLAVAEASQAIASVARERLILGDAVLRNTAKEDCCMAIFERKRLDDFVASLQNGHLQEQMARLDDAARHGIETWLVLEYHPIVHDQWLHVYSWLISIHTQPENRLKIMHTPTVCATWLFIDRCASMLQRQEPVARLSQWAPPKKRHLSVYLKTLLAIPAVSWKRAQSIQSIYPTMLVLADAIRAKPAEVQSSLSRSIGRQAAANVLSGFNEP